MDYLYEDIRNFILKRPWFHGPYGWCLVTSDEYNKLKNRALIFDVERASYLRAFMDGWKAAKE